MLPDFHFLNGLGGGYITALEQALSQASKRLGIDAALNCTSVDTTPSQWQQLQKYVYELPITTIHSWLSREEWSDTYDALTNAGGWKQWVNETRALYYELYRNPHKIKDLAELSASSPFLIKEIVKPIRTYKARNPDKKLTICEVGFGMGSVTRKLYNTLSDNDVVDAVELDKELYDRAQNLFPKEVGKPTINLHHSAFQDWSPTDSERKYDYVVLTVPFFMMSAAINQAILEKAKTILTPGGTIVYVTLLSARARCLVTGWVEQRLGYKDKAKACFDKVAVVDNKTATNVGKEHLSLVFFNATPCWVRSFVPKAKVD